MKKIFCALICMATFFASTVPAFAAEVNTAPSTDIDGTKHRLVKSVKVYCADYDTNEWSLDYTQNVEYQNAYPTMIEQVYSDEELGSSKMLFEYTFENNLPKTSVIKNDANHETTKIEYNNGRVYNVHTDNEGGGSSDTIYQYANGDGYFTSLLGSRYTPGTEYSPEEFAEEMDSVQIFTENGVIKKSINTGYFTKWTSGSKKNWTRFNGTYTTEYDSDGIVKNMSADFREAPSQIQKTVEVEKENGIITGTILKSGTNGAVKFEFEYTDEEINAARYAQMMNYFIIGAGSNYYNYNWY